MLRVKGLAQQILLHAAVPPIRPLLHVDLRGCIFLVQFEGNAARKLQAAWREPRTIFSAGSRDMDTSRKRLSRKGTRGSRPNANGALFARITSHWCSRSILRSVSLPQRICSFAKTHIPFQNMCI